MHTYIWGENIKNEYLGLFGFTYYLFPFLIPNFLFQYHLTIAWSLGGIVYQEEFSFANQGLGS